MSDDEYTPTLRGALSNALCNASNFPPKAAPHILGQDMTPLIDATVDAILHWLAEHDREVAAAERERCAKVAEGFERDGDSFRKDVRAGVSVDWVQGADDAARTIAAAIRAGDV